MPITCRALHRDCCRQSAPVHYRLQHSVSAACCRLCRRPRQLWSLHCHICLHVRKAQHCAISAAGSRARLIWPGHDSCGTTLELTESTSSLQEGGSPPAGQLAPQLQLLAGPCCLLGALHFSLPLQTYKLTAADPTRANSSWLAAGCLRRFLVARDGPLGSTCFS